MNVEWKNHILVSHREFVEQMRKLKILGSSLIAWRIPKRQLRRWLFKMQIHSSKNEQKYTDRHKTLTTFREYNFIFGCLETLGLSKKYYL